MKRDLFCVALTVVVALILCGAPVSGQGTSGLQNAGFEGPPRQTIGEGTSLSSWLATDWHPWSVLGDSVQNREVEYKLITLETSDSADLRSHVHSGNHAQQFFTNGGTHTAGFYQRVRVPAGTQVSFEIWVQIQTGDSLISVDGRYVSDLSAGGGNYSAQVGIDPSGATPAYFGAALPGSIQWSEPLWDIAAWGVDANGNPADLWVPIRVSARAQGEWVTVYTRGECKYPTKYNTSFWDDAVLLVETPPTPTRPPATSTPLATATATPTSTPAATSTPTATATEVATATSSPSPTPTVTATAEPTATEAPSSTPTRTPVMVVLRPTATATWVVVPTATVTIETSRGLSGRWVELGVVAVLLVGAMGGGLWIGQRLRRPL
ncbi:MAG: hypothetical protein JXA09_03235 [Anaerolineae bacterium]|nr:hypothetical protein [Anaerolineae bacterium]